MIDSPAYRTRKQIAVRRLASIAATVVVATASFACGTGFTNSAAPNLAPLPTPEPAREGLPVLSIVEPRDGDVLTSPILVEVEVDNYTLAPVGEVRDGEGHIHVIEGQCIRAGDLIGIEHVRDFKGAAEIEIGLEPGEYELCVQLGDGFHVALEITDTVTIQVEG